MSVEIQGRAEEFGNSSYGNQNSFPAGAEVRSLGMNLNLDELELEDVGMNLGTRRWGRPFQVSQSSAVGTVFLGIKSR